VRLALGQLLPPVALLLQLVLLALPVRRCLPGVDHHAWERQRLA